MAHELGTKVRCVMVKDEVKTAMLDIIGADFWRDTGDFIAIFKLGKLAFKASNAIHY